MHRCLQIQEILHVIIRNLEGSSSDLIAAALVCRAFYEHAMDHVWKDLRGLGPLIRCLPDDAYTCEDEYPVPVRVHEYSSNP